MDNLPFLMHSIYTLLGLAGLAISLKAVTWLISLKFASKDEMNLKFEEVYKKIENNRNETIEKLDIQHKEVLSRIDEQNKVFQEISSKIGEISAVNQLILKHLGLK